MWQRTNQAISHAAQMKCQNQTTFAAPVSQEKNTLTEPRSSWLPCCSSQFSHFRNVFSWLISSSMRNVQEHLQRVFWVLHVGHQIPQGLQGCQNLSRGVTSDSYTRSPGSPGIHQTTCRHRQCWPGASWWSLGCCAPPWRSLQRCFQTSSTEMNLSFISGLQSLLGLSLATASVGLFGFPLSSPRVGRRGQLKDSV